MIFKEHQSYPGFGYIEPIMDRDDPLIRNYIAERIIEHCASEHELLVMAVNWWMREGQFHCRCKPNWFFAARELLDERRKQGYES